MRFRITLSGVSALITHNGAAGLDTTSPAKREMAEITSRKGSNRTEADNERLRQLECQNALYVTDDGRPDFPEAAVRGCIEQAARKSKEGPAVREGMVVESATFKYDEKRYGTTVEELGKTAQFTVPVVVQRARLERTRAKFEPPWQVVAVLDCDPELIDGRKLLKWLDVAGRRVGLGDWRPARSGHYGRFTPEVEPLEE